MGTARPPDHAAFSRPLDVLRAERLGESDKRRVLLDWLEDEFALLVADDEGMLGGRAPRVDRVLEALEALRSPRRAQRARRG